MLDFFYQLQLWLALLAGSFAILLGLIGRLPSLWSLVPQVVVELLLVAQLVIAVFQVVNGNQAATDTAEFFAYLITALIIPLGVVFWALIDRSKWSTVILGAGSLTVAVMLVRMWQIWSGSYL